jgi:8-oxo-dGTP diphosphatase
MNTYHNIRIAAAIIVRPDGKTLLVRKRGTTAFMQAGGKIEQDETPQTALCRELGEELGLDLVEDEAKYIGRFHAPAANEPGWTIEAEVFEVDVNGEIKNAAEIEEIIWVDPRLPNCLCLAPLTRDHILPLCARTNFKTSGYPGRKNPTLAIRHPSSVHRNTSE